MRKKVTRWVKNEHERDLLIAYLKSHKLPLTATIEHGLREKRSNDQNRLQRLWVNEAAEHGDMTAEEYRAYCKLHFGVPILRNECDDYRVSYDTLVKDCYSYDQKLIFMALPFDFPVTRLMTIKQKKRYLDAMYLHFTSLGFPLTIPQDIDYKLDEVRG